MTSRSTVRLAGGYSDQVGNAYKVRIEGICPTIFQSYFSVSKILMNYFYVTVYLL